MDHKPPALTQVFFPINVLMSDPAFMHVEHSLGRSNNFS
jgi:hypothetical protein